MWSIISVSPIICFKTVQIKRTSVILSVARHDEVDIKLVKQIFANHMKILFQGLILCIYFGFFSNCTNHSWVTTSVARYDRVGFKLVEQIFANHVKLLFHGLILCIYLCDFFILYKQSIHR